MCRPDGRHVFFKGKVQMITYLQYKSKGFAAGCSREVIERGADQLGWELDKLLTMTLEAMKATEDEINEKVMAV